MKNLLTLVVFLGISSTSLADNSYWKIQTKKDNFTVVRNDNGYFIGNEKLTPGTFRWFRDFIDTETASGPCPSLSISPDLTVIKTKGDFKKVVKIYIGEKVLEIDDHCSQLKGEGIYRFPLVRSWYIGRDSLTIGIGKKREIDIGTKSVEYTKDGSGYRVLNGEIVPDWKKVERFEESLQDFEVTGRRRMEYAEDKKTFQFTTNGNLYNFYEVAPRAWAVNFPNTQWLVVSNSFQWGDFDINAVTHSLAGVLKTFLDKSKPQQARLSALQRMRTSWDNTIQDAYATVLQDESEDTYLRKQAAEELIKKPSTETKKQLGQTLISTNDHELLEHLTRRLQLYFRKGETIAINEEQEKAEEKLQVWQIWVESL